VPGDRRPLTRYWVNNPRPLIEPKRQQVRRVKGRQRPGCESIREQRGTKLPDIRVKSSQRADVTGLGPRFRRAKPVLPFILLLSLPLIPSLSLPISLSGVQPLETGNVADAPWLLCQFAVRLAPVIERALVALRQNAEHRVMPECHDRLFRATQANDFLGLRPRPNAQTTVPTPGPNLPAVALEHVNRTLVGPKPVDFMQARVQRDHLTFHPGDQQRLT